MKKILETRKFKSGKDGKPEIIVKESSLPVGASPRLTGRGKGIRTVFGRLGPAEIGPGTRKK